MGFLSQVLCSELAVPILAPRHPTFPAGAITTPLQDLQDLTRTNLEGAQPVAQSLSYTSQNVKNLNQVLRSERRFGLLESACKKHVSRAETTRDAAQFPDWAGRLPPCRRAHFHSLLLTRDFISWLTLCSLTRGQPPGTYIPTGNFTGEKELDIIFVQVFQLNRTDQINTICCLKCKSQQLL